LSGSLAVWTPPPADLLRFDAVEFETAIETVYFGVEI
jgi:hypothetical protein